MTEQQRADALLRQHQLQRILKEVELDIAQVVTAQYNPHAVDDEPGIDLSVFTAFSGKTIWEDYLA